MEQGHERGASEGSLHQDMLSGVMDCGALIARGMGWGMYQTIGESGIKPFLIEIVVTYEAVRACINGTLVDRPEMLH